MQEPITIKETIHWALIESLLNDSSIEATGNMRVQYLGIFDIIKEAQKKGFIVTTQFLVNVTHIDRSGILRATKALETKGFLKRKKILATHGRGRAWQYVIDIPEEMHKLLVDEYLFKNRK